MGNKKNQRNPSKKENITQSIHNVNTTNKAK